MALKHRLDRFISIKTGIPKRDVRYLLSQKRIEVDGQHPDSIHDIVDQFSHIALDGKVIQNQQRIYLMMHKPVGIVSATKDARHRTVIDTLNDRQDFLNQATIASLHIVGRLDLNTSGLLLLTNDSQWSSALMSPDKKVAKVYDVRVKDTISDGSIKAFEEGMYFAFEDVSTQPALLEKYDQTSARITLTEGKYHQIKRMFGRFRNQVLSLHRWKIGHIELDTSLKPGDLRTLTQEEIRLN